MQSVTKLMIIHLYAPLAAVAYRFAKTHIDQVAFVFDDVFQLNLQNSFNSCTFEKLNQNENNRIDESITCFHSTQS